MILHISNFDIVVWVGLFLSVLSTIVVACLGLSRRFSSKKSWRISLGVLMALSVILTPLSFHTEIANGFHADAVQKYTFHPTAPTTYDGMLFPAGSTVVESPDEPHAVTNGTVPDHTPLLGLVLTGDFTINTTKGPREFEAGRLAAPGTIHGVPCAPGDFKIQHNYSVPDAQGDQLYCLLAKDYTVEGMPLKADSMIYITMDHASIDGTLGQPWKGPVADCGPGDVGRTAAFMHCVLLHEMVLDGYPLAAGSKASINTTTAGERHLYNGTIGRTMSIYGVAVPAGSYLTAIGEMPSEEKLQAHQLEKYQSVQFDLPKSAHVKVESVEIDGSVKMIFDADHVYVDRDAEDQSASIHHDGVSAEHGNYDPATKKWCWEETCQ